MPTNPNLNNSRGVPYVIVGPQSGIFWFGLAFHEYDAWDKAWKSCGCEGQMPIAEIDARLKNGWYCVPASARWQTPIAKQDRTCGPLPPAKPAPVDVHAKADARDYLAAQAYYAQNQPTNNPAAKSFQEWRAAGYTVILGQKHTGRRLDGTCTFLPNQVTPLTGYTGNGRKYNPEPGDYDERDYDIGAFELAIGEHSLG